MENLDLTAKVAVAVGVSTAKSGSGVDPQFIEAIPQGTNTNTHQFRGFVFIPIAAIKGFFQIPMLIGARMENELNVIRTILLILGTVEPLAKGKLKQLFPHYFKQ